MNRFWEKVDKAGDCWEWQAYRNACGYGVFRMNGKPELAHRAAWALEFGEIPDLQVLHKCDNPACVNPDHLWLGSHADNMRDKKKKDRHIYGEKSPRSRLTEQDVRFIKGVKGYQCRKKLASLFNTTPQNIDTIWAGRSWAWV